MPQRVRSGGHGLPQVADWSWRLVGRTRYYLVYIYEMNRIDIHKLFIDI